MRSLCQAALGVIMGMSIGIYISTQLAHAVEGYDFTGGNSDMRTASAFKVCRCIILAGLLANGNSKYSGWTPAQFLKQADWYAREASK